jgi:hypothetical protein
MPGGVPAPEPLAAAPTPIVMVDAGREITVASAATTDLATTVTRSAADPYANTIVSLRARGVACLDHLEHGHYTATMVITVRSAGTVAHADVEAGNVFNDVAVACLNDVAKNAEFPSVKEGERTVRIDVKYDRDEWAPAGAP